MEEKYKWNLEDILKNMNEFEETKKSMEEDLNKIEEFKGFLCKSSDNLYKAYSIYEKALEKLEKLYAYGMLKYNLDMSNQEAIKLYKQVESLETLFSTKTSFITPEITYEDVNKIKGLHTLSKEGEELLANYSEIFSAPENTFDILTNAEFKFGNLINENGEEVELTESNYTLYLKSKNVNVRKQAFNLMYSQLCIVNIVSL